jgi:hypothetical protein
MKAICILSPLILAVACLAQQKSDATRNATLSPDKLRTELQKLRSLAEQIKGAKDDHEKARLWLAINRDGKDFADQMNAVFPDTAIKGNEISPRLAQEFAQEATSYGVRVDFCEPDGRWSADNQGDFKYLGLWPDGPEADEATWMGPVGHGSYCGDFEGSVEELQETITLHKEFLKNFPDSPFATQAREELTASETQLATIQKPNRRAMNRRLLRIFNGLGLAVSDVNLPELVPADLLSDNSTATNGNSGNSAWIVGAVVRCSMDYPCSA